MEVGNTYGIKDMDRWMSEGRCGEKEGEMKRVMEEGKRRGRDGVEEQMER